MVEQNRPQIQVDVSRVKPLFADEVLVASKIKAFKGEKRVEKEGNIELIFLDQLTQPPRAIARVVVSKHTADNFLRILGENVQKMDKDLKDKSMPKQQAPQIEVKKDKGYLG